MDTPSVVAKAIGLLGGPSSVARLRGLTHWAVGKWVKQGLPAEHVLWLAEETEWKFTPHELAPALYPHPQDGLPPTHRAKARARA